MWVSREMDEKKNVKICFAASSGGHYEQLMMLKPLMEKYDSFVITEKTDYSAEAKGEKTYYLRDKDERCGYVSGLMFFNQMGLTTQVPMMYEVVSNKATNDYRETSLAKSRVIVRKPKVPVTEKNYKALQFLDMLKDVDVYSELTGKPLQDRLYRYMDDANLSISEMEPYFAYYPDKLYKNLVETRVIYNGLLAQ